jgi:hypothetical protein
MEIEHANMTSTQDHIEDIEIELDDVEIEDQNDTTV